VLAYALAVLLPIVASAITARIPLLHLVPFALHFICMAAIAMLGGMVPALFAVLISLLSHNYYVDKTPSTRSSPGPTSSASPFWSSRQSSSA
jgi:hypothetical protein